MPSRILNPAIDFFARLITGFCPDIAVNSSIIDSSALPSVAALPSPMLIIILSSVGISLTLLRLSAP